MGRDIYYLIEMFCFKYVANLLTEYIPRCLVLMSMGFLPVLGPDSRKRTDIHPRSELPDRQNEGREGGVGTLCWRVHNDESLNI